MTLYFFSPLCTAPDLVSNAPSCSKNYLSKAKASFSCSRAHPACATQETPDCYGTGAVLSKEGGKNRMGLGGLGHAGITFPCTTKCLALRGFPCGG